MDVLDREKSGRFATLILYLNAPDGGETVFPDYEMVVQPQPGRLAIFPPLWTFVHAGLPPQNGSKWVLSQWVREKPMPEFAGEF